MRTKDVDILLLPGVARLPKAHWQARLAERLATARLVQADAGMLDDGDAWCEFLARHFDGAGSRAVVVAHGLGAIATVHALNRVQPGNLAGVFFVAPIDVEQASAKDNVGFATVPMTALPVPSVVVAPSDNPACSLERARAFAEAWGSELSEAGECGRIDHTSGHGPWPEGLLRFGVFLKSLG